MKVFFKALRHPLFLVALVLVSIGAAGYLFNQYQLSQAEVKKLKENPQAVAQEETKELVKSVGALMTLPSEEPTVATVTDAKKLKNQAFFAKAENGDKVLIYTQGKKAILYRPGINKIIEVAPVNIGSSSAQSVAGTTTQNIKIALYNGTTTTGLTNTAETALKAKVNNIDVVAKANATKNDYEKSIVVDLSGKQKTLAEQFAKLLNADVASLPEGETKPNNADILIILGSSYTQ